MNKFLLSFLSFGIISAVYAQEFQTTFGGGKKENSYHVLSTPDKGVFSVGSTESFGSGKSDIYLVKTDANGNIEWSKSYGGAQDDFGTYMDQTNDGNYILLGYSYSFTSTLNDIVLIKVNIKGEVLWTKTYGLDRSDYSTSLQCTSDGGFIILGESINFIGNDKNSDILVMKVKSSGDLEWSRVYGGNKTDYGYSIQQTKEGGYVIGGETNSYGAGEWDFYLLKLKANGDVDWSKTFGGPRLDYGRYAQQCPDGGYIIGGNTQNFGAENTDFCLVKTDYAGNVQWSKIYGGNGMDYLLSMRAGANGLIFTGYSNSIQSISEDMCLVYIDYTGKPLWSKLYGSAGNDYGVSVNFTKDNEVIVGGSTNGFGTTGEDVYLMKVPLTRVSWACNLHDFYPFTSKKVEVVSKSGHYEFDLHCDKSEVQIKVVNATSVQKQLCDPKLYVFK